MPPLNLFLNETVPDPSQEGATPPERPEWLLEKFKSPEEQARAYAEAEKRMTQLQSTLDQERQQFAETIQSVQETMTPPEPTYNPNTDPILMNYERAVNEGDARAMLAIQLQLNQQLMEQAIDAKLKPVNEGIGQTGQVAREQAITLATERVKRDFGEDWDEMAPRIAEVLQQRPHWIPPGASVDAFETTLREVAELLQAQDDRSLRQKEEADRVAKIAAQGLTGSGARQIAPEEAKQEWERIRGADLGGYAGIIRG